MSIKNAGIANLKLETEIAAPPQKVWQALTDNIGQWWPADFYAGGEAGKRNYVLESSPGGRMFEQWEGGGGVLWGNVVSLTPGKQLQVLGVIFPNWGGPTQWFGTWDLAEKDGATVLTFSESAIGAVSEKRTQETHEGWVFLWNCMKAHVEGKPEPGWGE